MRLQKIKTFKVVFMKVPSIRPIRTEPAQLAEQIVHTWYEPFEINVPSGYIMMTVTEILPETIIINDEKTVHKVN